MKRKRYGLLKIATHYRILKTIDGRIFKDEFLCLMINFYVQVISVALRNLMETNKYSYIHTLNAYAQIFPSLNFVKQLFTFLSLQTPFSTLPHRPSNNFNQLQLILINFNPHIIFMVVLEVSPLATHLQKPCLHF